MTHYLRYFLALSLISTTISAQDAAVIKSDKSTLAQLGQSMKDFTKRIKRYYACAMGKCSQQEIDELKEHIWSDGAILVAAIVGLGAGTYLIKEKAKTWKFKSHIVDRMQNQLASFGAPRVTENNGAIIVRFNGNMPEEAALYDLTEKVRGALYGVKESLTAVDVKTRDEMEKMYGYNYGGYILRHIPLIIQFNNKKLVNSFDGFQSRGILTVHDPIYANINSYSGYVNTYYRPNETN
jgi:hypothetical protein